MTKTDVLIVGAGLSGLCLAQKLGRKTILVEKSRGVGGRIATRRIDDMGLDHGAPLLPDDLMIRDLFREAGLGGAERANGSGLYLPGAMTQIPKAMARGLDIRKSTRVTSLRRTGQGWQVETDGPEVFQANDLVITAPLPQALELLDRSRISVTDELRSITYTKALMALIVTQDIVAPDRTFSSRLHSLLSMRERGLHPRGFVVRASEDLSEEFFDQPEEQVLEFLRTEFLISFSTPPDITYQELKKWRYVLPKTHLSVPFAEVSESLWLTGDSFRYGDARGAIVGAELLAEKLN